MVEYDLDLRPAQCCENCMNFRYYAPHSGFGHCGANVAKYVNTSDVCNRFDSGEE